MLLPSAAYIAFTVGFLFFHWGGQYRYELFYFPSPVAYTLESLTATGRMVSVVAPVLAVSILILSAAAFQIPSPSVLSTEEQRQQASVPRAPMLKPYLAGVVAAANSQAIDSEDRSAAPRASAKRGFLDRLFPYERQDRALTPGVTGLEAVPMAGRGQTTIASYSASRLLTTT